MLATRSTGSTCATRERRAASRTCLYVYSYVIVNTISPLLTLNDTCSYCTTKPVNPSSRMFKNRHNASPTDCAGAYLLKEL